jgi:hypothetical protein
MRDYFKRQEQVARLAVYLKYASTGFLKTKILKSKIKCTILGDLGCRIWYKIQIGILAFF